jgi:hypothetical protein
MNHRDGSLGYPFRIIAAVRDSPHDDPGFLIEHMQQYMFVLSHKTISA